MIQASLLVVAAAAATQSATGPAPLELRGMSRGSYGAAKLIVAANGLVEKCEGVGRPYDNVMAPPDLCAAYPVGTRYGPPATHKGKPQRREITVRMEIYEKNIR